MLSPPSLRGFCLALVLLLLVGPGCRKVSQPALDDAEQTLLPVEQDGQWGYINRKGAIVIDPQFDRAYHFVEDRALIQQKGQYGFIAPSGSLAVAPTYTDAWHFSDGLAPVQRDSLWGFINPQGAEVIEPRFALATQSEAKQRAPGPRSPTPTGQPPSRPASVPVLVLPHFAEARYFSDGRARIHTSEGWGFIDQTGAVVIAPQFAWAQNFRNGLARIRTEDGQMGYVTRTGMRVWPPKQ